MFWKILYQNWNPGIESSPMLTPCKISHTEKTTFFTPGRGQWRVDKRRLSLSPPLTPLDKTSILLNYLICQFGQFILWKIIKVVATRSHLLKLQVIWAQLMRRATALAVPIRRLSWSRPISIHFDAIHSWNLHHSHKLLNNTKTTILEVQGHSGSSTLTPIKSLSLLFVMISSISVPICNRFHFTRDNCGKITTS